MNEQIIEKIDPLKFIADHVAYGETAHIKFDPTMEDGDYKINRGVTHDGTLFFTYELIHDVLFNIITKRSYWKTETPDWSRVQDVEYTVGFITLTTEGRGELQDLPCGRFPGERQTASMPVCARWMLR